MKKLFILIALLLMLIPVSVEAKNKPLPYTYHYPHIYYKNGYTNIEWHSDIPASYVIFKFVGTHTYPLGIQYKPIPIWHRTLPAGNIRIRFKGNIPIQLRRVR